MSVMADSGGGNLSQKLETFPGVQKMITFV
jgi:hypothetical protein